MDFALNEQQEMMQALAKEFLTDEYTDKVLKAAVAEDEYNEELWQKVAAINLPGLAIPEEYGGVGNFLDLVVVLEEMGRACFISPFFSTTVLGASAILEAGSDEQKRQLLPDIAEGKRIVTLAIAEETGKYDPESINSKAEQQGSDYVITGRKLFVTDAQTADLIICAVRTTESDDNSNGVTLFILDSDSDGITINPLPTFSGDKIAEVILEDVKVSEDTILGEKDGGWSYLEKILQKANVARCAEMMGLSKQALDLSLEYAKERIAFGHPIGAFQAIQHLCANMLIDLEGARFITYRAAWKIAEGIPAENDVAIAKAWVSQASRRVMKSAHQVHGAIGFSEDHILHYYTKKARYSESCFGDADYHRERLVK